MFALLASENLYVTRTTQLVVGLYSGMLTLQHLV